MKEELVCIVCPRGCSIEVEKDEAGNILSVKGNSCSRGEEYAINEMTNPRRRLTTTVGIEGAIHNRLPVMLSDNIPKNRIGEAVAAIRGTKAAAPVKIGDVIIENVCGMGVDLVATRSMGKWNEG